MSPSVSSPNAISFFLAPKGSSGGTAGRVMLLKPDWFFASGETDFECYSPPRLGLLLFPFGIIMLKLRVFLLGKSGISEAFLFYPGCTHMNPVSCMSGGFDL